VLVEPAEASPQLLGDGDLASASLCQAAGFTSSCPWRSKRLVHVGN